jgi:putative flippase GtrA
MDSSAAGAPDNEPSQANRLSAGWHFLATRERVLYVVVGAWNSVFQYLVFASLVYLLSGHFPVWVVLPIAYVIGSLNGFMCFKYIVFRSADCALPEYLRFNMVYVPLLLINMVALPALIHAWHLNAYAVQALLIPVFVVAGYVANKLFTFRKGRHEDLAAKVHS